MLCNTDATTRGIVTRHVPMLELVTYSFVTRQVPMDKMGTIFLWLHVSYTRANWPITYFTRKIQN